MFDCAIIGSGPAGVSAALTLKARNKNFIWFGNKDLSIKVTKAEKIRNYPGMPNVSGSEMKNVFLKQIEDMGISIEPKTVTGVYKLKDHYSILCNQDMYEAKTIIVATGVALAKTIPGEEENLGMGVSYCATCDGFLYKGKEIAVVCQGEEFEDEVNYLAEIASKVNFIPLYKNYNVKGDNINVIEKRPIKVTRENGINIDFEDESIHVNGVFFLKSSISANVLVPGLNMDGAHVVVDRMCKTNLDGCFACGDITGRPYQYTKSVGEGNIAAHSVLEFLAAK